MTSKNIMGVAREWLVTNKTSANPERVRAEFDAWLQEDPQHRSAYERAEREWRRLDKAVSLLGQERTVPPATLLSEIHELARRDRRGRQLRARVRTWSITLVTALTGMALLTCVFHWLAPKPAAPAIWIRYVGGYGRPQRHVLSDGSVLYLNGKSAASVRMTEGTREVALDEGEVLVHVKQDRNHPFLVRAGNTLVWAVGTLFSVRRDTTGEVETVVQQGTVNVDPNEASAPSDSTRLTQTIAAGQSATISGGHVRVENHDPDEIDKRLAWVRGLLYLHGTLVQAVSQFNEQNERQMIIQDESIKILDVTGLYDSHDPREFVESLRSRGVRYRIDHSGRIALFAAR